MELLLFVVVLISGATGLETCSNGQQRSYRGTKAATINGRTCQAWSSQTPHGHGYTPENFPDGGLVANYCRNPDDSTPSAWCYTMDSGTRWEVCGVPQCLSGIMFGLFSVCPTGNK